MQIRSQPPDAHRTPHWTWCLAALLPVLASLGFDAAGPRPRAVSSDETPRPGLAFDQYLVNLGPVAPAAEHRAFFAFTNTSSHPVTVTALKPSCGCLDPKLAKATWQPGERAVFSLKVLATREEPGPKEYFCTVHYDDGQPREARLSLKVTLPVQKLIVQPRALIVYQFTPDPVTRPITLTRHRTGRLTILNVTTSSPLVAAHIGKQTINDSGHRQSEVLVTIGKVPPGRHQVWVNIETDDPEYRQVRVPVMVQGPKQTAGKGGTTRQR